MKFSVIVLQSSDLLVQVTQDVPRETKECFMNDSDYY